MAEHGANQNDLVFLPLGGAGEIGMNLNCYGYGPPDARSWIVIDCGVLFGRETTTPGVDLMMPDVRFLEEQRASLLGLVLTHGHEDHLGAVAHLLAEAALPGLRDAVHRAPLAQQAGRSRARGPGEGPYRAARRQDHARPVRADLHLHHPFDTGTQRRRDPHAVGHGRAHRRLEDRSPNRSSARSPTTRRCASWARRAFSPASAIRPMRSCRANPAPRPTSKPRCTI